MNLRRYLSHLSRIVLLSCLLATVSAAQVTGPTIPISGSGIIDTYMGLVTGTLTVTITDLSDNPITYTVQGGSPTTAAIAVPIVQGTVGPGSIPNPATVSPSAIAYRLTINKTGGSIVYTLPKTIITPGTPQYSLSSYTVPAGLAISGAGFPRIPCQAKALYTDTVNGGNQWICSTLATDGSVAWTQNPSSVPQCSAAQALVSPSYGAPYCTASSNAYASPNLVIGSGNGPAALPGLIAAPATIALSQGIPQALQLSGGAGNAVVADNTVQVGSDHSLIAPSPRINIKSSLFALGWTVGSQSYSSCAGVNGNATGYADSFGILNSRCAAMSAIAYSAAWAAAHPNTGYMPVYFPGPGIYNVSQVGGYAADLEVDTPTPLVGDDASASTIYSASPSSTIVMLTNNSSCNQKSGQCSPGMYNLRLVGNGHLSTGNGLELLNAADSRVRDVVITNIGGISLNLVGSTERSTFEDIEINHANKAVLTEGDTNENYFRHVQALNPGNDESGYCYSLINCPGGVQNTVGPWYAEPEALVELGGVNLKFEDFSVKGLELASGIKISGFAEDITVDQGYLEGYPYINSPPTINHSLEIGGTTEIGHLTAAITSTALTIPIDDAVRQPVYINDPAWATGSGVGLHGAAPSFRIGPSDFLWGSSAPSTAVPGITRGTFENITVFAASADGALHLAARGSNAIAWPAGSPVAQNAGSPYGTDHISNIHINADAPQGNALPTLTKGCDDNALLPLSTVGAVSRACAEVLVGYAIDGFVVPPPNVAYTPGPTVDFCGNSIYFQSSDELDGSGWFKILADGQLNFCGGDDLPHYGGQWSIAALEAGTYQNYSLNVQFVYSSGVGPYGSLHTVGADVFLYPINGAGNLSNGSFTGLFLDGGNVVARQSFGPQEDCEYGGLGAAGSVPITTTRSCLFNGGFGVDLNSGTSYQRQFTVNNSGTTVAGSNFSGQGFNFTPTFATFTNVLAPVGGVTNVSGACNYPSCTVPITQKLTFVGSSGGATTVNLPACTSANSGFDYLLTIAGNVNPVTLASTSNIYINNQVATTAYVISTMTSTTIDLYCTGTYYTNIGTVRNLTTVTMGSGSGIGGGASGAIPITVSPSSDAETGTFSFTSGGSAGVAATIAANVYFTPAISRPVKGCELYPLNANATSIAGTWYTVGQSINGFNWETTSAMPASTAYTFGYRCNIN